MVSIQNDRRRLGAEGSGMNMNPYSDGARGEGARSLRRRIDRARRVRGAALRGALPVPLRAQGTRGARSPTPSARWRAPPDGRCHARLGASNARSPLWRWRSGRSGARAHSAPALGASATARQPRRRALRGAARPGGTGQGIRGGVAPQRARGAATSTPFISGGGCALRVGTAGVRGARPKPKWRGLNRSFASRGRGPSAHAGHGAAAAERP